MWKTLQALKNFELCRHLQVWRALAKAARNTHPAFFFFSPSLTDISAFNKDWTGVKKGDTHPTFHLFSWLNTQIIVMMLIFTNKECSEVTSQGIWVWSQHSHKGSQPSLTSFRRQAIFFWAPWALGKHVVHMYTGNKLTQKIINLKKKKIPMSKAQHQKAFQPSSPAELILLLLLGLLFAICVLELLQSTTLWLLLFLAAHPHFS